MPGARRSAAAWRRAAPARGEPAARPRHLGPHRRGLVGRAAAGRGAGEGVGGTIRAAAGRRGPRMGAVRSPTAPARGGGDQTPTWTSTAPTVRQRHAGLLARRARSARGLTRAACSLCCLPTRAAHPADPLWTWMKSQKGGLLGNDIKVREGPGHLTGLPALRESSPPDARRLPACARPRSPACVLTKVELQQVPDLARRRSGGPLRVDHHARVAGGGHQEVPVSAARAGALRAVWRGAKPWDGRREGASEQE